MLRAHRNLHFLVVEEAFIVTYQHLGLDLFHGLKDNTHDNDDGCSAEGNICPEHTVKEERNDRNNNQAYYTYKYNIIQDFRQIV